jgi:protoheme IX farnesyltransferase
MTKPTITLLVVITTVPGFLLALDGSLPNPLTLLVTLIGAGLVSASAATFNQMIELETDSQMVRTKDRSLPSGKVSMPVAGLFGLTIGLFGLGLLYFYTTPLAALVALAGHLFYVVVYTWQLKRRTPQNIVIGGAAGAVGPLIGWAATGSGLELPAWIMFAIIFFWTPPHFWALSLKYKDDYQRAGIPMYPVVYGENKTRKAIFLYSLALLPIVVSLYFFSSAGIAYLVTAVLMTLKMIVDSFRLYRSADNTKALPLFYFSCLYTFAIFGVLAVEYLVMLS